MIRIAFTVFCLALLITGCASHATQSQGGASERVETNGSENGRSCDTAVVIAATSESKGIAAENSWIRDHYQGYKKTEQALVIHNDKPHDLITIEKIGAEPIGVCFNISSFFGKW